MQYAIERKAMLTTAQALKVCGLSHGCSGNLSLRVAEGFLITPTGLASENLQAEQMVFIDQQGQCPSGQLKPSSEWRFHHDLYTERDDIAAIIHIHSTYATVLACHRKSIPAFHYMIAEMGGDNIRCADYATFGAQPLSDSVMVAMQDRKACLMANHGMLAAGHDLSDALNIASQLEELCKQYVLALQIGDPVTLSKKEMTVVLKKFKSYGVQSD